MAEEEDDKGMGKAWVYVVIIVLNVLFLLLMLLLYIKKWIDLRVFIFVVFGNMMLYLIVIAVWYIKNKFFGEKREPEIKETDVIDKKQARVEVRKMMKIDHSVLIDTSGEDLIDDIIHLGAEDKPKTPIYILKGRNKYSKDIYRVAMRLDNPTKTVVRKNGTRQDFMEAVKMLAETSPREDVITKVYYKEGTDDIIRTEREVRRAPARVVEKIDDEKKVVVGE